MSGDWGLFLLLTAPVALIWYFGDRTLLTPRLRAADSRYATAARVAWQCLGVLVILGFAAAIMQGDPVAIGAAMFINMLAAGIIWGIAPRVGQGVPDIPEAEDYDRACGLLSSIHEAARHASLSDAQRASILEQVDAVPGSVAESLRKVARVRRIAGAINRTGTSVGVYNSSKELAELRLLESRLTGAIQDALQILVVTSVALMKVELARDERIVARILGDLTESNQRMWDLADSWEEVKRYSLRGYPGS
jgi:hypothetical protein